MHIKILTTACLFVLFAAQTQGAEDTAEEYLLHYKFKMGEVIRYRVHDASNTRTTIEETTQEVETRTESIKAWKITDVLPSGEIEFVHVVEAVRLTNTVPNRGTTTYNSETDKAPPANLEHVSRSIGIPLLVVRIQPDGTIVDRQEKHPVPPSKEDLPMTLQLPTKAIAVGQQWDRTYEVDSERKSKAKLKVRTRRVCTLKEVKDDIATIQVEYQILTPVSAFVKSQLKERLTKGTVRFDLERGRIVSQKHDADCHIIGFSGKASSIHYVSRQEERLLKPGERLARK